MFSFHSYLGMPILCPSLGNSNIPSWSWTSAASYFPLQIFFIEWNFQLLSFEVHIVVLLVIPSVLRLEESKEVFVVGSLGKPLFWWGKGMRWVGLRSRMQKYIASFRNSLQLIYELAFGVPRVLVSQRKYVNHLDMLSSQNLSWKQFRFEPLPILCKLQNSRL